MSLTGRVSLSDTRHQRCVRSLPGKTHGTTMLPPAIGPGSFVSLLAMCSMVRERQTPWQEAERGVASTNQIRTCCGTSISSEARTTL